MYDILYSYLGLLAQQNATIRMNKRMRLSVSIKETMKGNVSPD
jgi:hypothetical protein